MLQLTDEEDRGKPDANENSRSLALDSFEEEPSFGNEESKISLS